MVLMDPLTGRIYAQEDAKPSGVSLVPVLECEPYYPQRVRSLASPRERTSDGFDMSHLSPEHAWRLGRDYIAHALRYGWPMHVIKREFGAGARIFELGCGKEVPMIRVTTCDHSAVQYYKPSLYVGADLNAVKYHPAIDGIDIKILEKTNVITDRDKMPDSTFDLVVSFEVLEHMDKVPGLEFLSFFCEVGRRKAEREGKAAIGLLSTPVNGGNIAKNHIYEWGREELRRNLEKCGAVVRREFGMFSNIHDLLQVLSKAEREVWNQMADFHSPHLLSCFFSASHPEVARNIAWEIEFPVVQQ